MLSKYGFIAAFLICGTLQAQPTASNSKMTLSVAGQQRFALTKPGEPVDAFIVKAVDASGHPIPGLTVEFFTQTSTCPPIPSNCAPVPGGLSGRFPTIDGSGEITVLTDADGVASGRGFVGGTVSGMYTVAARIDPLESVANKNYVGDQSLNVEFDVEQSFDSAPIFGIQSGISGSWFNPETNGQGFNIEVFGSNLMLVYFYTFDTKGNNLWLIGVGDFEAGEAGAEMMTSSGGQFPPNFDPSKITHSDWGKLHLHFSDCNHGTAQWTVAPDNTLFQSGQFLIQRITSIPGLLCQ